MLFSRQRTARVSELKRAAAHTSHSTFTSGRKLISMVRYPLALAGRAAPAPVLKEKRLAV